MRLDKTLVDAVLEPYVPACRYLLEEEMDYPALHGRFKVPTTFYCAPTGHLNAVELLLCYNQLIYVGIAQAWQDGQIPGLGRATMEEFRALQLTSLLIVGMDSCRFKKPIRGDELFDGYVRFGEVTIRQGGALAFLSTHYDFAAGRQTGRITCALVRPKSLPAAGPARCAP